MTYGNYPKREGVKKILVVKLRHLGDVLLATPVFSALKKTFPEAAIDAYVYKEAGPVLEGHPAIRKLWLLDREKRGIFSEIKRLSLLRREGYDWVLSLTEGDRAAITALASGAKVRAGFSPKGFWQKKIYTHPIKEASRERHTVEKGLDGVRCLGIFPPPEERELFFSVPEEARRWAGEAAQEGYVLIHPTSRWRYKCWPKSSVRALLVGLLAEGKKVVVTSGPALEERRWVEEALSGVPGFLDLSGKTSIQELGALIEGARVVVCVDSFCLHLTSALKKRVVALFGPTSEKTWAPWNNPEAVVLTEPLPCRPCYQDGCGGSKYSDCLERLSVERVRLAIGESFPQNSSGALPDPKRALPQCRKEALSLLG